MNVPRYGFKETIRTPFPERQLVILRLRKLERMHERIDERILAVKEDEGGKAVKDFHQNVVSEHCLSVGNVKLNHDDQKSYEFLLKEFGRYTHQLEQLGAMMSDFDLVNDIRAEIEKMKVAIVASVENAPNEGDGRITRAWKFLKGFYTFSKNADWKVILK